MKLDTNTYLGDMVRNKRREDRGRLIGVLVCAALVAGIFFLSTSADAQVCGSDNAIYFEQGVTQVDVVCLETVLCSECIEECLDNCEGEECGLCESRCSGAGCLECDAMCPECPDVIPALVGITVKVPSGSVLPQGDRWINLGGGVTLRFTVGYALDPGVYEVTEVGNCEQPRRKR